MPFYDFQCPKGHIYERIADHDQMKVKCPKCGKQAKRIISQGGTNCSNQDASWLPSVLEVVDKSGKKPHCNAFLKNPTRANYKAWMKGEGLRPMEPGEESHPFPDEPNTEKAERETWEAFQEDHKLHVGGR